MSIFTLNYRDKYDLKFINNSLHNISLVLGSVFENDGQNNVLSFWFENEIVDVVLSNRFRKRNETKISSKNVVFCIFFQ